MTDHSVSYPGTQMHPTTPISEGAQRILRIAAPLFAQKGFNGVSINDIAESVGGSKANIFHHFPNKQALYLAALGSACESFRGELDKAESSGDDGANPGTIARRHLDRMFADPDSVRLVLREAFAGDKGQDRAQVAEILHQNFSQLVAEVEQARSPSRECKEMDPAMVALAVIALNNLLFQSWSVLERFAEFRHFTSPQACAEAVINAIATGSQQP